MLLGFARRTFGSPRQCAEQQLPLTCLLERLFQTLRFSRILVGRLKGRVEQILGPRLVVALSRYAVELEQDSAFANFSGLSLASPNEQQQRAVGSFGSFELAILLRHITQGFENERIRTLNSCCGIELLEGGIQVTFGAFDE